MKKNQIISVFIILLFFICNNTIKSQHYAKSGEANKIKWGASQETVKNDIKKKFIIVSEILPSRLSYKLDHLDPSFSNAGNIEEYTYLFNEKDQLYGVKISYNSGLSGIGRKFALKRNKKIPIKLEKLLGTPDDKNNLSNATSNFIDKTWNPKSSRKNMPNIEVKTEYKTIQLGKYSTHIFNESYINTSLRPKVYPIHYAVLTDDVTEIKKAIEAGQDINKAVQYKLNRQTHEKATPLLIAVLKKKRNAAKFLINNGVTLNTKYDIAHFNGNSLLIMALALELDEVAKLMIEKGADIHAKIEGGKFDKSTVLHIACENGNTEIIQSLLDKGADIEAKNKKERTPLVNAIVAKKANAAILLLNKGAKFDSSIKFNDKTMLIMAISLKQEKIALELVERGFNVNEEIIMKNFNGNTQLIFAILLKYNKLAKIMIAKGADINAKIKDGTIENYTALHAAAELNNVELVKILLDKGADKTVKAKSGKTPVEMTTNSEIKQLLAL